MAIAIKVTDNTKIRIETFENDVGRFLNVRKFYKTKHSDEWKPAAQGIAIPEDLAARVIKAMKKELEAIDENVKTLPAREGRSSKKSGKKGSGKGKSSD